MFMVRNLRGSEGPNQISLEKVFCLMLACFRRAHGEHYSMKKKILEEKIYKEIIKNKKKLTGNLSLWGFKTALAARKGQHLPGNPCTNIPGKNGPGPIAQLKHGMKKPCMGWGCLAG